MHLKLGGLLAVDIARCLEVVRVIGLLLQLLLRRLSLDFAAGFLALSVERMLIGLVRCRLMLLDQAGIVAASALLVLLIEIVLGKVVLEFL